MDETQRWQGRIERLGWGGVGVARAEDGRVILLSAPLALFPGEQVEADVRWRARHGEGVVTAWVTRAARRAVAECSVAARCGGCDLWEGGDETGELKRQMIGDLLHRSLRGVATPELQWLPAPQWARRQRIQLHWDGARLGYHARGTHEIVTNDACLMAISELSSAIPLLRHALISGSLPGHPARWELACGTPRGDVAAVLEREGADPRCWRLRGAQWVETDEPLTHDVGGMPLQLHPASFAQACMAWAVEAFSQVFTAWELSGEVLHDLYGGGGFFSVLLHKQFLRSELVESDAFAAQDARHNLARLAMVGRDSAPASAWRERSPAPPQRAGFTWDVHAATVEQWLPERLGDLEDVIIVDPPRAGLSSTVIRRLATARAGRIVLVGCDGANFCRDVQRLCGARRLTRLAAIDLFPNTVLVEFVALLDRA